MNKDYEIFKTKLETTVTTSNQDVGMVYYIMKDVFDRVEKAYYQQVQNEINAERQAQMKKQAQAENITEEEDVAKSE